MKDKIDALLAHEKLAKPKKLLENTAIFVAVYVVFAAFTYILPYYEMASDMAGAMNQFAQNMNAKHGTEIQEVATGGGTFAFILHLIALSVLVIITYIKAVEIKKTWIVVLPILAFGFDVLPLISLIPLVPTGLHIATIILGAKGEDKVVYVETPAKEEPKNDD